jgi:hypothetical protein
VSGCGGVREVWVRGYELIFVIEELFDAFQVMTCYNQTYSGLDNDTIQQIFEAANWQWNYQLNNSELATLQYVYASLYLSYPSLLLCLFSAISIKLFIDLAPL